MRQRQQRPPLLPGSRPTGEAINILKEAYTQTEEVKNAPPAVVPPGLPRKQSDLPSPAFTSLFRPG